jgi:hypothetical protein
MTNEDKVIELIRQIIAKAEATPYPAEAETLMQRAQVLMARHSVDQAMVNAKRADKDRERIVERTVELSGIYATAHVTLFGCVAEGHGSVRVIRTLGGLRNHEKVTLVGHESDAFAVEMLATSLMVQSRTALNVWWPTVRRYYASGHESTRARRDYLVGFAVGVKSKMTDAMSSVMVQESASTALVLRGRSDAVNEWVDERFGKLREGRGLTVGNSFDRGYSDGRTADVGQERVGAMAQREIGR